MLRRDKYNALHIKFRGVDITKAEGKRIFYGHIKWLGINFHRWSNGRWIKLKILWITILNRKLTDEDYED